MTWVFLYFTLVHMVFEAQGKYHFMLMPLVCILAALVVQDTPCGKGLEPLVGRRRPADKPTRGREMTLETPSHLGAGIVILTCAALAAAGLAGCEYISPPPPASQPAETRYNEAYAGALAAVDDFCQAWVKGDAVAGRALLSVRMQRRYPDQLLGDVIAGSGNPRHAAYEIHNGRRLGDGRYAFDVRLFFCYSGVHGDKLESPLEQAIVAQDDAGRWRIDAFPIPEQKAIVEPSQPTLIPSR
jgi:hypothetical protein